MKETKEAFICLSKGKVFPAEVEGVGEELGKGVCKGIFKGGYKVSEISCSV